MGLTSIVHGIYPEGFGEYRVIHEFRGFRDIFHRQQFGWALRCPLQSTNTLRLLKCLFVKENSGKENECIQIQQYRAQRLINLEIPVLVQSLKSSNVEMSGWETV